MHEVNVALVKGIREFAATLDHLTGALNTITQFSEAYLTKAAVVGSKLRSVELEDIQAFAANLRTHSQLTSEDTAKVVIAWMENRAVVKVNQSAHMVKAVETIFRSVHILGDISMLGALKSKLSSPPPAKAGEN
jgi:NADH/NAD ratio-sensing transcriptional regulator Rex